MNSYRVRVFLTESYFQDMVLSADNGNAVTLLAQGMSPIGRAILLGNA